MHDTPDFATEYKNLTPEIIDAIPKVILNYEGPLEKLMNEQVAYAEQIVEFDSLESAVSEAEKAPFTLTVLVRCSTAEEVNAVAAHTHPAVVGVVGSQPSVVEAARNAWLPYVSVGDTAFEALTPRISHAVALFDDFTISETGDITPGQVSAWIRDRGVPIVCDPRAELADGAIESMMDHPLPLLRSLGFKATAATMTTELLLELAEKLELTIEDLYELTMEAMEASFIAQPLRQQIIDEQIMPVFEEWGSSVPNARSTSTEDTEEQHSQEESFDESALEGIDPAMLADLGIDPESLFPSTPSEDNKPQQ